MQSQNQMSEAKEKIKPIRAEQPGFKHGGSIHGQLPMALAAKEDCAFLADIGALSVGLVQLQDKPQFWPHLWKRPMVNQLPSEALEHDRR